jgi:hypothetical protein
MATREDIYAAIRNADQAGDSASVRKLGEYLQTLPAETPPSAAAAPATPPAPPSALKQTLMAPVGAAEMLWQGATGAVASIPAAAAYGGAAVGKALGANVDPSAVQRDVQAYFTHKPVSDSAKAGDAALAAIAKPVIEPVARKYDEATQSVAAKSPFAGELMKAAPGAFQAASVIVPGAAGVRQAMTQPFRPTSVAAAAAKPAARPAVTAEDVLAKSYGDSQQSMGAAAAAPRLQSVSPELKQAIVAAAGKNGGAVAPEVLARHIDADSLPVPVRLTEGQATGDVTLLSHEQNLRGRVPAIAERFNDQGRALAQNLQAIRDNVGPDVFSANHVEHGDTLMNAYRAVDEARNSTINQAYTDLRAAAGGQFPIGADALLQNVDRRLGAQLITEHAPRSIMNALRGFATNPGSMTFENFEAMRTNLATIQRTATDGLERRAAGEIRQAMEDLPLSPQAAQLKPLADRARSLARERFQAIEADPAYSAVVNGTVEPDDFVRKFITGGKRDDLTRMAQTLGSDESARQTMGVAALDHLRDAARLNPHFEGNFAAASFNKALQKLGPGIQSMLPARTVEQLEQLARVANYTTAQPRGSFVNNSNTFVAAAAEHAKSAAEGAANVAAWGLPVGTWARRGLEGRATRRQAERAMAPGAGLGRLRDIGRAPGTP